MSELARQVRDGDRRALARAITLVESTRPDHRHEAAELLSAVLPHTGDATRIGISGAPGSGKSTFIDALGRHVLDTGHRLAVLAVDPTSERTGGSILGDKTRMTELSRRDGVFVRPSPTGGTLGGVARRTREAMLLCEAAGFDVVLVETVGVGQSEVAVAGMVDLFLLLLAPGGGDDLQGIKRGVVELADLVVVNKADGDLVAAARAAATDYGSALTLVRPRAGVEPRVMLASAREDQGIEEVWEALTAMREQLVGSGALVERRTEQARHWMWSEVTETLLRSLRHDEPAASLATRLEADVTAGTIAPAAAAEQLLEAVWRRRSEPPPSST